ncbi:MAG: flagella synthesis protein FlgN [Gammaproteobacteria bacterium]
MNVLQEGLASQASALLSHESQCVEQLRELLLEERAAIGARDADRLQEAVRLKLECLRRLEQHEHMRRRLVAGSRLGSWQRLLASLDPGISESWQALRESLRVLRDLTEVNERIVNRSRQSTRRLLELMRGQSAEGGGVYDRSGRALPCNDARAVTTA